VVFSVKTVTKSQLLGDASNHLSSQGNAYPMRNPLAQIGINFSKQCSLPLFDDIRLSSSQVSNDVSDEIILVLFRQIAPLRVGRNMDQDMLR
jgi:hypothetical protein